MEEEEGTRSAALLVDADDDDAGKNRVGGGHVCARLGAAMSADVRWAAFESHVMIAEYLGGPCVRDLPVAEQRAARWLRYNPVYWVLLAAGAVCVLAGRWVHVPFGQGGPVRDDESRVEHEARVQWIYATDGPFAASIAFTALDALVYGPSDGPLAVLFDLLIDASYILGNCLFLDAMRRKNVAQIRVGVVANAAFAVALLALLVAGLVEKAHHEWAWPDVATWTARAVACVFFAGAVFIYAGLWNAHGDRPETSPTPYLSADMAARLGMATAAAITWALLVSVVVISPTFVWDAVAA